MIGVDRQGAFSRWSCSACGRVGAWLDDVEIALSSGADHLEAEHAESYPIRLAREAIADRTRRSRRPALVR